jgi:sulfur-oxidizing protein SoxY
MSDRISSKGLDRREVLITLGAGAVAMLGAGFAASPAHASGAAADAALKKLVGDRPTKAGKVHVKAPPIAENGNTVPLTVSVDSPMTEKDYVKAVHVVADGNPRPEVASFYFSPMSGKSEVSTRIRMAKTQNVIAVAEMSDGTLYRAVRNVKVTIGGCGG